MQTTGKITHWKGDKGYGFITPDSGAERVFVHISSFSNRNPRPRVNELVTYTLSTDKQGRPCAVQVTREGEKPQRVARRDRTSKPLGRVFLVLFTLVFTVSYAYKKFQQFSVDSSAPAPALPSPYEPAPAKFQCDGRTQCSQMTSCEEASFFIENCPGTQMDEDGDGVPCESQWCG